MAMRSAYGLIGLTLAIAAGAARIAPSSDSAPSLSLAATQESKTPEAPTLSELVEHASPAVVLLLSTQADRSVVYGAGFLVGPGLVLTSQHVVAGATTLGAMLYKAGRTSYTPMDGGLSRYLFENQADIVKARWAGGDATSDLAIVQLDVDTSGYPTLPMAEAPVRPGDRVFAFGHPQETVWSFTQGIVGAIEHAAIQHDAAISPGSSGGPLLNHRGEVVGVNIAKVMSEEPGFAFARPIAFAGRYLGNSNRSLTNPALDLSTPQASAVSCWRAQETGRVETGDCFDWDTGFAAFEAVAAEAMRVAPPEARTKLKAAISAADFKQRWTEEAKRGVAGYFTSRPAFAAVTAGRLPAAVVRARAEAEREEARLLRDHPEVRGLYADRHDPAKLQARLRLGIRVDKVSTVTPDRAWVELEGRNPDGSSYRFSELYAKIGDRWLQRMPLLPTDSATLPSSFAPPLCTYAEYRARKLEKLLSHPESVRAVWTAEPPAPPPPAKGERQGCTASLCEGNGEESS